MKAFIAFFVTFLIFTSIVTAEKNIRHGFGLSSNIVAKTWGFNLSAVDIKETTGLFIDFKTSLPTIIGSENFYNNISLNKAENIFHDRLIKIQNNWLSINVGILAELHKYYALYFGLGVSWFTQYRQYKDNSEILGKHGEYWIENENVSTTNFDLLSGILITPSRHVMIQVGYEKKPYGINLGIGFIF